MADDVQLSGREVKGMLSSRSPFQVLVSRLSPTHVVLYSDATSVLRKVWAVAKSYMQSCECRRAFVVQGLDLH